MKPLIKRYGGKSEYYFLEGCYINELLNDPQDEQVSVARARVRPGDVTRWHSLQGTTERYVILEGMGEVEIGQDPSQSVWPGDVVMIPAGIRQRIRNIGREDLVFLAVCSPRFQPEAYVDLDDVEPIPQPSAGHAQNP